jgi:hypothetical protein
LADALVQPRAQSMACHSLEPNVQFLATSSVSGAFLSCLSFEVRRKFADSTFEIGEFRNRGLFSVERPARPA